MTDEAIKTELIEKILKGGEVQPQLYLHRELPPENPFFGFAYFLSEDSTIAFLVSRLPVMELAYDVYISEE